MDDYEAIENIVAAQYGQDTTSRQAIGDFMLDETHAVNVKSHDIDKANVMPRIVAIKRMHKWVYEENKTLSFIFVDWELENGKIKIVQQTDLIPIEKISWKCLTIEAQGCGVILKHKPLTVNPNQTKEKFRQGFMAEYERYKKKEIKKHKMLTERFSNYDN